MTGVIVTLRIQYVGPFRRARTLIVPVVADNPYPALNELYEYRRRPPVAEITERIYLVTLIMRKLAHPPVPAGLR